MPTMEAAVVQVEESATIHETTTPESPEAQARIDYVLTVLGHVGNRQRLRALTLLYNAARGLDLNALALALDVEEDKAQGVLDRLTKAGLVSPLPVLDDERLGWEQRFLATPAAREWLERVALANGKEAAVPA